jgi:cytochrome c oxidase subunit 3
MTTPHASHFESAAKQAHAARLGMWVFLGSELLLFAGLFALYGAYRAADPSAFQLGIASATKLLGSLNTGVLLVSSALVALAVHAGRHGRRGRAVLLLLSTMACGGAFLFIKLTEYAEHFREGIRPGGVGHFFSLHHERGLATFWTLYYASTGLHAIHVCVGIAVLGVTAFKIFVNGLMPERLHFLENAALYWHLIDVVWIFLWPLYYLG